MKKIIAILSIIAAAAICAAILCSCSQQKLTGTYSFGDDGNQSSITLNEDGTFDEHKVMYGFPDMESARQAYLSNYEDGWRGLGTITPVSKEEFKKWIDSSHRKTKPFSEYKGVKTEGDVMPCCRLQ